jgi:antitoxin component YwqK of YwqJK toxin-antitoxin module
MKTNLTLILCFLFTLSAFAQTDSSFTDYKEAKNITINGLKEGKWAENIDDNDSVTHDINAPYFRLTVYKAGQPTGIVRYYSMLFEGDRHNLYRQIPYSNGKINGLYTEYYFVDGEIRREYPYKNGVENGVARDYWMGGQLKSEVTYVDGKENGVEKFYNEDGKLISKTVYKNGKVISTKNYDKSGNKTKQ